jgi:hypothetical protein
MFQPKQVLKRTVCSRCLRIASGKTAIARRRRIVNPAGFHSARKWLLSYWPGTQPHTGRLNMLVLRRRLSCASCIAIMYTVMHMQLFRSNVICLLVRRFLYSHISPYKHPFKPWRCLLVRFAKEHGSPRTARAARPASKLAFAYLVRLLAMSSGLRRSNLRRVRCLLSLVFEDLRIMHALLVMC